MRYRITTWFGAVTDSGKDVHPCTEDKCIADMMTQKFRLLDDDDIVVAEGMADFTDSFMPLDDYQYDYGLTEIQWLHSGVWTTL